jgi:OOP family OmpA-OmpF porin
MNNKIKTLSKMGALLGFAVIMQGLQAEGQKTNSQGAGAYIGASVGQTTLKPRVIVAGGGLDDSSDMGYKIYGGYKYNSKFAVEGFYTDMGSAGIHTLSVPKGKISYKLYGLSGVYTPQLTKRLNGIVKLGYADVKNSTTTGINYRQVKSGTVFGGLGLEYAINSKLSVRGEYEYFDKDIKMLSIGLNWKF